MNYYDFLVLQPNEFENLTRDILQKNEGVFIESFTIGRDGGIDLRFASPKDNKKVVIQAKRYKSYDSLLKELKKEVNKVKKMSPDRYVLSTSVGLTPSNKDEILTLFSPYIKSTADILGKDDLNNLLGQYPDVEKQYYKLWLASTTVLQSILNKRIENWSAMELEETRKEVSLYVMNDSFDQAINILRKNRYVIISGIPGIGKTTLARMLIYNILSKDFDEFIKINSMDDAAQKLTPGKKQIFFYDDFLGSSFLDIKEAGFESKILAFIDKVKREPDKLFILSTREYILAAAKRQFEKFSLNNIELAKCTLDLSSYSEEIRASILYNHLADAELPIEYINALLYGKRYLKLIKHDNFNPRIIEAFLKERLYLKETPERFVNCFLDFFDRPYSVWEFAFSKMSPLAQKALLVRATMGGNQVYLSDWFDAVKFYLNGVASKDEPSLEYEWHNIIKDLLGTFITTIREGIKEYVLFHNPSIYDFLFDYIRQRNYLQASLIENALFSNQVTGTFTDIRDERKDYGKISIANDLECRVTKTLKRQLIQPKTSKLVRYTNGWMRQPFNKLLFMIEMINSFPILFRSKPDLLENEINIELFGYTRYNLEDRMTLLNKIDPDVYGIDLDALVELVIPELMRGYDYVNTISLMERSNRGRELMVDHDFVSDLEYILDSDLSAVEDEEECQYLREDIHELAKHYSSINVDAWDEAIDDVLSRFASPDPEYDDWDVEERHYSGSIGTSDDYYDLYSSLL